MLKSEYNHELDKGFDIIKQYFVENPDQRFIYVHSLPDKVYDNVAEISVAMQILVQNNLAKTYFQLTDKDGTILPTLYDEVEDIPKGHSGYDLVVLYELLKEVE